MKIAMIQMKIEAGRPEVNIAHAFTLLEEAACHADLLILPEMWTVGYALRRIEEQAITAEDGLLQRLSDFAGEKSITLIAGSLPYKEKGNVYNSTFVYSRDGSLVGDYQKIHLFSLLAEPRYITAGNKLTIFPFGDNEKGGLSICYDLRFPELYRKMAYEGAGILFIPAQWPLSRNDAWETLCRARAIENQVYVCAVNCVGDYKNIVFHGNSLFIGPDGTILERGSAEEEILYVEFERSQIDKVRAQMACWQDCRYDLYGEIVGKSKHGGDW